MRILLAAVLVVSILAPLGASHSADGGAPSPQYGGPLPEGRIGFRCGEATVQGLLCPLRILDEEDVMGSPRLVLHPKDWSTMAFNALHGGPGLPAVFGEAPAPDARNNAVHQPHTTFRSPDPFGKTADGRLNWEDQPYYSPLAAAETDEPFPLCPHVCPSELADPERVYGIDNALAIDPKGRMFEGSLYAHRVGDTGPWSHSLVVWKQQNGPNKDREQDVNYAILRAASDGNTIDTVDLAHHAAADQVVAVWRESLAPGATPNPLAPHLTSWLAVAWSKPTPDDAWHRLAVETSIGPCAAITNLVARPDAVYVGCVAAPGYEATRPGAREGDLDVYRIRLDGNEPEYVSTAPVKGDAPRMVARRDGAFAVAAASLDGLRKVRLEVAFGIEGADWGARHDVGSKFVTPDADLAYARVNALGFSQTTGTLFLVQLERLLSDDESPIGGLPVFRKRLGAIDPQGGVAEVRDLQIGLAAAHRTFPPSVEGLSEDVFGDLHDDLETWVDKKGRERMFLAFGDYGEVLLAELVENDAPPLPGGPLAAPPPAQPVLDPQTATQSVLAIAGAGTLAGLMVLRLLASRKKHKVEAPSLMGK